MKPPEDVAASRNLRLILNADPHPESRPDLGTLRLAHSVYAPENGAPQDQPSWKGNHPRLSLLLRVAALAILVLLAASAASLASLVSR